MLANAVLLCQFALFGVIQHNDSVLASFGFNKHRPALARFILFTVSTDLTLCVPIGCPQSWTKCVRFTGTRLGLTPLLCSLQYLLAPADEVLGFFSHVLSRR